MIATPVEASLGDGLMISLAGPGKPGYSRDLDKTSIEEIADPWPWLYLSDRYCTTDNSLLPFQDLLVKDRSTGGQPLATDPAVTVSSLPDAAILVTTRSPPLPRPISAVMAGLPHFPDQLYQVWLGTARQARTLL